MAVWTTFHYAEDGYTLCHEQGNRWSPISEGDDYSKITCTKCAKILGNRLFKRDGVDLILTEADANYNGRVAYKVADKDGTAFCMLAYQNGTGWKPYNLGYALRGVSDKRWPVIIPYPNWNNMYEDWLDRKDYPLTVGLHTNTNGFKEGVSFNSKELALWWCDQHRDAFLPVSVVEEMWAKHIAKRDAKQSALKAAEQARKEHDDTLEQGLLSLHARTDLTNLERAALEIAMEELRVRVPDDA